MSELSIAGAGPTLEPIDILIVDDEPDIASPLREFLDDAGYRVQVRSEALPEGDQPMTETS